MRLIEVAQSSPLTKRQVNWLNDALRHGAQGALIGSWKYNTSTKMVDVAGHMRVYDLSIPVPLGTVLGNMWFSSSVHTLENSPRRITGTFDVSTCKYLRSLKGAPDYIDGNFLTGEAIESLQYFPRELDGTFSFTSPLIQQRLLRLFKYPQIRTVVSLSYGADRILNKHLKGDRDILLCQDELIEAGYGFWARI